MITARILTSTFFLFIPTLMHAQDKTIEDVFSTTNDDPWRLILDDKKETFEKKSIEEIRTLSTSDNNSLAVAAQWEISARKIWANLDKPRNLKNRLNKQELAFFLGFLQGKLDVVLPEKLQTTIYEFRFDNSPNGKAIRTAGGKSTKANPIETSSGKQKFVINPECFDYSAGQIVCFVDDTNEELWSSSIPSTNLATWSKGAAHIWSMVELSTDRKTLYVIGDNTNALYLLGYDVTNGETKFRFYLDKWDMP